MNAHVDVILPFRNAASTLDAALASLLAASDDALTVLAIDDASTDSSASRVRAWAQRDARVRIIDGTGSGLVAALNLGITHARGALIARMDSDDVTHPERIARQRRHLLAHPEISVLGTRVRAFSERGSVGEGLLRYVDWQNGLITPEQHRRERFVESPLCHPAVMLRRSLFDALGGYRELDGPEDYELFLRCAEHGHGLAKLPDVLLSWRHQPGRATFSDARYGLSRFRAVKAPYLARELARRAPQRLALWGAGPTGRRLARALAEHGARPALFIDVDPAKVGRTAQGAPICPPDALDLARDCVVAAVGARGARDLIRADLERRGFREGENAWFAS